MAKCLIADDSKIIRMLLTKIMSNFGFEVLEAEDGEEVYESCVQNQPDLIIMDYSLPILDGIDVLYKIREDLKIKQPKIFFCSSINNTENIRQALNGGADDYIIKPFDEEIIATKLAIVGML